MVTADQVREAILTQSPTDQQKRAIFAEELEFLLRAAPGSGKTWTSCRRFFWRAASWPHPAGGLALLSFTNAAIREFKAATITLGPSLLSDPNYVGTFDSFVERYILGPFGHLLTDADKRPKLFSGPRPGDRTNTQLRVWRDGKSHQKIPVPAWDIIPSYECAKIRFRAPATLEPLPSEPARDAVRALLALGLYSHSQRVFWACTLLSRKPHIADVLARRFPEIIVDEAQDSSAWWHCLLNCLRRKGARITLVGDPDQCIFEFGMADAEALPNLKTEWSIPERSLTQSFRCNNQIAAAVRNIGGNKLFTGAYDGGIDGRRAFVARETSPAFCDIRAAFQCLAGRAGVNINSAAIVCRGHAQLQALRGNVNYTKLQGKAERLAEAAFLRDFQYDYRKASQTVESVVRDLTDDDSLWERCDADATSAECRAVALAIWRFVKSPDGLPPISWRGDKWVRSMRKRLNRLIKRIGVGREVRLGNHIKTTGLSAAEKATPLFVPVGHFPRVRCETIHHVKGESIDAVLVIGSERFWNSVVEAVQRDDNTEDRRLAYVAMTRARHLLVVGLPKRHYDRYSRCWVKWGFEMATGREPTLFDS